MTGRFRWSCSCLLKIHTGGIPCAHELAVRDTMKHRNHAVEAFDEPLPLLRAQTGDAMTASIATIRKQGAAGERQAAVLDETTRSSTLQDKAREFVRMGARTDEHFRLCWATLEKLLRSLRKLKVADARALAGGGAGPSVANPESAVPQKAGQQKRRRQENRGK